jgi:hypothetical protein
VFERADQEVNWVRGFAARSWLARGRAADRRAPWRVYAVLVLAALIVVGGLLGYVLGRGATSKTSVTTVTGVAYTNASHQTVVTTGGWTYNVPRGVAWVNSQGSEVDGSGPPPCLRPGRSAPITFGMTPVVVGGSAIGIRAVVWVECGVREQ